jgi:hypothetical protein
MRDETIYDYQLLLQPTLTPTRMQELPFKLHEPGWMAPAFTGTSEQASALAAVYWRTVTARPGA